MKNTKMDHFLYPPSAEGAENFFRGKILISGKWSFLAGAFFNEKKTKRLLKKRPDHYILVQILAKNWTQ